MVEVEPDQLKRVVADLSVDFLEVFAETFLWALFVDQVDEGAVLVVFLDVLVVFFCHLKVQFVVGVDVDFGAPLEVWVLVPEEGHWASELHMGEDILLSAILC
jgi:hypothetical protein